MSISLASVESWFVPSEIPKLKNLEISFNFIPAFEVGGDYYDFFKISDSKLGFVIADVSGKGISAAFVMAEIKGIFESLSKMITSPKELLIKANEILERSIDKKSFVTAIYGIINTDDGKLIFSRAGHTPLLRFDGLDIDTYSPNGLGLGLDYTPKFKNSMNELEIQLNNDDILILFTDGVTESQDENFNLFGLQRLKKIISNVSDKNLSILSAEILQNISKFSENSYQYDDITLLLIKWKNLNK